MHTTRKLFALSALVCLVWPVHAGVVTHTGNTTSGSTYNRLLEDLSAPSAVGTAVRQESYSFSVSAAGSYTFLSTARFDNFLFLYSPSINPALPLINARAANDDLLGQTTAGFAYDLVPGVNYVVVTTGFDNTAFGAFSNTIGGPGTIMPVVAEPAPVPITGLVTYTGNTSADPTFNRPLADLSALSGVGTAVRYDSRGFRVDTSGTYSFLSTAEFDNFSFLYSPSLNAALPLANALAGNDDLLGLTTSGFDFDLVAGIDYYFVTAGFSNSDFGAFSNTIAGPGAISALLPPTGVAEPASLALMLLSLGLLGLTGGRTAKPKALPSPEMQAPAQRLTLPSADSIDSSTKLDPRWLRGPKPTM